MKINIKKCLEFLDNPPIRGHATAIVGVIGEELNACAFKHYMDSTGKFAEILLDKTGKPISVTQGTSRGKRLDRWIEVKDNNKKILYQCEIKNWSATAIGGRFLEVNADGNKLKNTTAYYWSHQMRTEFSNTKYPSGVTKVFVKMRPPDGHQAVEIEPLLIYWMPVSNSSSTNPFFDITISEFNNPAIKTDFKKLKVFSVSLYFRQLLSKNKNNEILDFDMPYTKYRMGVLKNLGFL